MPQNSLQGFVDRAKTQIGPLMGMPGGPMPPGAAAPAVSTKSSMPANGMVPGVRQEHITDANIAETARQEGVSIDVVKAELRRRGYTVP